MRPPLPPPERDPNVEFPGRRPTPTLPNPNVYLKTGKPVSPLPQPTLPKPSVGLKTGKVDAETGLSDADWRIIEILVLIPLLFGVGVFVGGLIWSGFH